MKKVLVTGGAGFIGSSLVKMLVSRGFNVLNVDALKYCGSLYGLENLPKDQHEFAQIDITDAERVNAAVARFQPQQVYHLAAESHVDRSIASPEPFIQSNIVGTYNMLQAARDHAKSLEKFVHVSTDEVYGSLDCDGDEMFTESTPYQPSSPYSASKAAADHLVKAWVKTYNMPCAITNCSNNFGPRQFPEKLIPVVINNALAGKALPIYGDGKNQRDWIYVEDHNDALMCVMEKGQVGETYLLGARNVLSNNDLVKLLCQTLDHLQPNTHGLGSYDELITYVQDRAGHDRRYAIDPSKIEKELGWKPKQDFSAALEHTVQWYLSHRKWLAGEV